MVYKRQHGPLDDGSIVVSTVSEDADGYYAIALRVLSPDGSESMIAVGATTYQDLAEAHEHAADRYLRLSEAQDAADVHVRRLGHECSAACATWPPGPVTH